MPAQPLILPFASAQRQRSRSEGINLFMRDQVFGGFGNLPWALY
jgi:hypothetical protein